MSFIEHSISDRCPQRHHAGGPLRCHRPGIFPVSGRWLARLLALALAWSAAGTLSAAPASITLEPSGQLQLQLSNGQTLRPALAADQVGFAQPALSRDGRSAGWLALYPNCCTSYPIALALVIYHDGRMQPFRGNELAITRWRFERGDRAVAFMQETVHGHLGVHFELRSLAGDLLEVYEGDPQADAPAWVRRLAAE